MKAMYLSSYFGCTYHASLIRGRRNRVSLLDIILYRFNLFAATAGAGACAGARTFHEGSVQLQLHVQMQLHVQLQVHVQVHVQAQVHYHSCRCICKCVCKCSCKCMCMCTDSARYFLFFQARRCSERFCRLWIPTPDGVVATLVNILIEKRIRVPFLGLFGFFWFFVLSCRPRSPSPQLISL